MKVNVLPDANTGLTLDTVNMDKSLKELAKEAAFMEEVVTVEIAPGQSEADNPCVILNVNGTNQPVWRGHPTPIRRKYLEVLARMKQTNYSQRPTDYIEPERSNALQPRTSQVYPFQVLEDKNPKGLPWLRQILAEAA